MEISCPFPETNLNNSCPNPYNPVFNAEYCSANYTGSALNLISGEMQNNSTQWLEGTIEISNTLQSIETNQSQVDQLIS